MIRLSETPASLSRGDLWHFSSMSLSLDQVQRITLLARIAVSEAEARGVAEQLNRVLGLIDQIQALDTRGIEPMSHPLEAVQRLRPDLVTEENRRELYQQAAPPGTVDQGLYLVPKVIE